MAFKTAFIGPGEVNSSYEAWQKLVEQIAYHQAVAVDTETISLKDRSLIGVGLACNGTRFYAATDNPLIKNVMEILADKRITKVYFNCMFDLDVETIFAWDDNLPTPDDKNIADVFTMAQMQALPTELAGLYQFMLMERIDRISDVLPKGKDMLSLDFPVVAAKCMNDVKATWELYQLFGGAYWGHQAGSWTYTPPPFTGGRNQIWNPARPDALAITSGMVDCYKVDLALVPLLRRMSWKGIKLRSEEVEKWYLKLSEDKLFYEQMFGHFGINPGSNQQVGYLLAERGNMLPFTKSGRQLQVDEEILAGLSDPLAQAVLAYRKTVKLLSTYILPCRDEPRFDTHFRLDLATGRLASYNRNVQNIPSAVRGIFAPDAEEFTIADANQIEMRFFAYMSQDPTMLNAYKNKQDIHAITQLTLWPGSNIKDDKLRTITKGVNFSMIYDAMAETLARNSGLSVEVCREFRDKWFKLYPKGREWMLEQEAEGDRLGYRWSVFGRKIRLPGSDMASQRHLFKTAVNYPVQGSAADYIKRCMLKMDQMGFELLIQVHDEVVINGKVDFPEVFEGIHPEIEVPFKVRHSAYWEKP